MPKSPSSSPAVSRKASGRNDGFLKGDMKAAVANCFAEFDAAILARPLMTPSEEGEMKVWKARRANQLLNDEAGPFANCTQDGEGVESRPKCYGKIMEAFKNHYQYHHVKNIKARRAANSTLAPNTVTSPGLIVLDSRTQEEIGKMARAHFMSMVGSFGGRDYFILHNEKAINDMKEQVKADAEPGSVPQGGGLLNAARTRAWEECGDKEKYEEMARNHNPQLVRDHLPSLLSAAFKDVLRRDAAGSLAIKTILGYRRPDGSISTSMIAVAYDASQKRLLDFTITPQEFQAEDRTFSRQVDEVLPSIHNITIVFPLNEDQVPLWHIDSTKASPPQLADAIKQFTTALWVFSFRSLRPIPPFPFADLKVNPEKYYDTTAFTLPSLEPTKPADLYLLADLFDSYSKSATPFQFYRQDRPPPSSDNATQLVGGSGTNDASPAQNTDNANPIDNANTTNVTHPAGHANPMGSAVSPTTSKANANSAANTNPGDNSADHGASAATATAANSSEHVDRNKGDTPTPQPPPGTKRKANAASGDEVAPPRQRRKANKQKENTNTQSTRSLRKRDGGKAVVEQPKPTAPTSCHVPASQRFVFEPIIEPSPAM
ncbi:hypothetical protein FA13DRAFT_1884506 [Coprinellus micaceus]|uniref:Uncharacterized protein n=1 Tax=Coprinellus micaceus TaxID=71717 RepID=A0A4Y7SZ90_COPMI|nr:hypothetical protein FA13DRAFT_1884506 [Coprinellus micaceus]